MRWTLILLGVSGCATLSPAAPRFLLVSDQRTAFCRIQVIQDTRTDSCFVGFRCARQPITVLEVDPAVCVP